MKFPRFLANIAGCVLAIALHSGCSESAVEPRVYTLYPDTAVVELSDNSFLTNVTCMAKSDGGFLLADYGANRLIELDSRSLRVRRVVGSSGEGPGEFRGAGCATMRNGKIFGYDAGGRRIHVFGRSAEFETSLPNLEPLAHNFVVGDVGVLLSSRSSEGPIAVYGFDGTFLRSFGPITTVFTADSEFRRRLLNDRLIFAGHDGMILAAHRFQPIVEQYNADGELLASNDLSGRSFFRDRVDAVADRYRQDPDDRGVALFFGDGDLVPTSLYLLYYGSDGLPDEILVMSASTLRPIQRFKLLSEESTPVYAVSVAVGSNRLLVFDGSERVLYRYALPLN